MDASDEAWISVDVEASSATPGTGSLLSIGACLVADPSVAFYVELRPIEGLAWDDAAERIHRLDRATLERDGQPPAAAMAAFAAWVDDVAVGRRPVFVAYNATFDWMFVADYFGRFLGRNPFGHDALDIEALYMGVTRTPWREIGFGALVDRYEIEQRVLTHNALDDALVQAELFRRVLDELSGEDR